MFATPVNVPLVLLSSPCIPLLLKLQAKSPPCSGINSTYPKCRVCWSTVLESFVAIETHSWTWSNRSQYGLPSLRFLGYSQGNCLTHCKMYMPPVQQAHALIHHWGTCLCRQHPCQSPVFLLASIPFNHTILRKPGQADLIIKKAHRDLLEAGRRKASLSRDSAQVFGKGSSQLMNLSEHGTTLHFSEAQSCRALVIASKDILDSRLYLNTSSELQGKYIYLILYMPTCLGCFCSAITLAPILTLLKYTLTPYLFI